MIVAHDGDNDPVRLARGNVKGFETQAAEAQEALAVVAKKREQANADLAACDDAEAAVNALIAQLQTHLETANSALTETLATAATPVAETEQ